MGSYVYFKNSPSISLLFFRPLLLMLYLKKKSLSKEFYCRVAFISYSTSNERKLSFVFQVLVDPIPALFTLPN